MDTSPRWKRWYSWNSAFVTEKAGQGRGLFLLRTLTNLRGWAVCATGPLSDEHERFSCALRYSLAFPAANCSILDHSALSSCRGAKSAERMASAANRFSADGRGCGAAAMMVVFREITNTSAYIVDCSHITVPRTMARRRGKKLIFAYLAVCPLPRGKTVDGLEVGFPAALRVESVSATHGNLTAKLSAKNQPSTGIAKTSRWRALFGFYTTRNAFKQQVRPAWNRSLKNGWQEALREGIKLGAKHSQGTVYVSENARSEPPCPILQGMQRFTDPDAGIPDETLRAFWHMAVSKIPLGEVKIMFNGILNDVIL